MKHSPTVVFTDFLSLRGAILLLLCSLSAPSAHAQTSVNWVSCASEWQTCSIPAGELATVRYGANEQYSFEDQVSDSISCTNARFGGDPAPGVFKSCAYTVTSQWVSCASEWGTCAIPFGQFASVRYGANDQYTIEHQVSESINCTNGRFGGDPAPGVFKSCSYTITAGPNTAPPTLLGNPAFDNQTLSTDVNAYTADLTVGWEFSTDRNITIHQLGVRDGNYDGELNGTQAMPVAIFDAVSNGGAMLVQTTVPLNRIASADGMIYSDPLETPLSLEPGSYMILALTEAGGEAYSSWNVGAAVSFEDGITYEKYLFSSDQSFSNLNLTALTLFKGIFGPTFRLEEQPLPELTLNLTPKTLDIAIPLGSDLSEYLVAECKSGDLVIPITVNDPINTSITGTYRPVYSCDDMNRQLISSAPGDIIVHITDPESIEESRLAIEGIPNTNCDTDEEAGPHDCLVNVAYRRPVSSSNDPEIHLRSTNRNTDFIEYGNDGYWQNDAESTDPIYAAELVDVGGYWEVDLGREYPMVGFHLVLNQNLGIPSIEVEFFNRGPDGTETDLVSNSATLQKSLSGVIAAFDPFQASPLSTADAYQFVRIKPDPVLAPDFKFQELEVFTVDPFAECRSASDSQSCSEFTFGELMSAAETFLGADLNLLSTIDGLPDVVSDQAITDLQINSANHNSFDIGFKVGEFNANLSVVQTQAGDPELLLIVDASDALLTSLKLDSSTVSAVGLVPLGFAHEDLSTVVGVENFSGARASSVLIGDLAAGAQVLLLGDADVTTYSDKYIYIDAGLNFVGFTSDPFLPDDMNQGLDTSTGSSEKIMITGGLGASSLASMNLFSEPLIIDQMHLTADIPLTSDNGVYSKDASNSFGIKGEELIASIRKDGTNIAAGLHFLFELDINGEALEFDARIEENYDGQDSEFVIGVDLVDPWIDPLGLDNTQVNNLSASLSLDDSGNKTFFGSAQVSNGEYVYKASLLGLFPPQSQGAKGFISMDLTESRQNHSIENVLTKEEFKARLDSAHGDFSDIELPHFVSHVTDYGISISHELNSSHYSLTAYARTIICSKPIAPGGDDTGSGGGTDLNVVLAPVFNALTKAVTCPHGSTKTDLRFTISGSTDDSGRINSFSFKASTDYTAATTKLLVEGNHVILQKGNGFSINNAHAKFSGQWVSGEGWSINAAVSGDLTNGDREIEFALDFVAASSTSSTEIIVDARFKYDYKAGRSPDDLNIILNSDFPADSESSNSIDIDNLDNFHQGDSGVAITADSLEVQVIARRYKEENTVKKSLEVIVLGQIQWTSHKNDEMYTAEGFIDLSGSSQVIAFHLDSNSAGFEDVLQHGGHSDDASKGKGLGDHFSIADDTSITVFLTHNYESAEASQALQNFIDQRYANQTVKIEKTGVTFVATVEMQQGMRDELGFANIGATEKFIIAGAAGISSAEALDGSSAMVDQYNAELALELIVTNCEAQMHQNDSSCLGYQNNDTPTTPAADYDNGFADWFNHVDALLSISILKDLDGSDPSINNYEFDVLLEGLLSIHRHEDALSDEQVQGLITTTEEQAYLGANPDGENLDLTVKGELQMEDGRFNLILCAALNESGERDELSVSNFETVNGCLDDEEPEYATTTRYYKLFDFHNVLFKDLGIGLEITPASISFDARGKAKFHLPTRNTDLGSSKVVAFPNLHGMEIDVDNLGFEVLAEDPFIPVGFELDVSVDLDGNEDDLSDDKGISSQEFHNLHLHTKYPMTIDGDDSNDGINHDEYEKGATLPRLVLSNYQGLPINGLEKDDRLTLRMGLSADSMFPAHFQIASGVDLYTTKSSIATTLFEIVYATYSSLAVAPDSDLAPIISSSSPYVHAWLIDELNISDADLVARHIGDFDVTVDSEGLMFNGSLRWGEDHHFSATMASHAETGLKAFSDSFLSKLEKNTTSAAEKFIADEVESATAYYIVGYECWRTVLPWANSYRYIYNDDSACNVDEANAYSASGFNYFNGVEMSAYGVDQTCADQENIVLENTTASCLIPSSAPVFEAMKYDFNWTKSYKTSNTVGTGAVVASFKSSAIVTSFELVAGVDFSIVKSDSKTGFMGSGFNFKLDYKANGSETIVATSPADDLDTFYSEQIRSLPGELFDVKSYAGFVDFDGDQKTDLVLRNSAPSIPIQGSDGDNYTVQVDSGDLYYSSAGRDSAQLLVDYDLDLSVFPVGSGPLRIQFGDVNGDGKTDIVRESLSSNDRIESLSLYLKDSGQSTIQDGVNGEFTYAMSEFIDSDLTNVRITNWLLGDVHPAPGDELIIQYEYDANGTSSGFNVISISTDLAFAGPVINSSAPTVFLANMGGTLHKEIALLSQPIKVYEHEDTPEPDIPLNLGFDDATTFYLSKLGDLVLAVESAHSEALSLSDIAQNANPVDVNGDGRTDWLLPDLVDDQSNDVAWNVYFCADGQNQITSGSVNKEPSTEKGSCDWTSTTLSSTKYAPHEAFETGDFNGNGYTDLLKIQDVDDNGTLDFSVAYGGRFKDDGSGVQVPIYRSFAPYKLNSINDVMAETQPFALGTANGTRIDSGSETQFKFYQQLNQVQATQ